MSGRLASAAITTAGVPQKIYTVPSGKVLAGALAIINGTAASATLQIKNCVGLSAPTATFPFSNAQIVLGYGAGGLFGSAYSLSGNPDSFSSWFRSSGNQIDGANGSRCVSLDVTSQLAPVMTAGLLGANSNASFSRDERHWNTQAANRFWAFVSGTLTRYIDATSSPFKQGAVTRTFTSALHGAGYEDAVIAVVSGDVAGRYRYGSSVASTSGTAAASTLTGYTEPLFEAISQSDFQNPAYSRFYHANGVWFFAHVASGNSVSIWSTTTPQTVGSWKAHSFACNLGSREIIRLAAIHHYGSEFHAIVSLNNSNGSHWFRTPDTLAATNPLWLNFVAPSSGNNSPFSGFMRSSGQCYIFSSGGKAFDLSSTSATLLDWPTGITLTSNYATVSGKLPPVTITALHAVVTTGAVDTTNDLTAYGADRVWRFVTDTTWGLQHVTTNADWLDPSETIAVNGSVEYRPRLFSAGDEIWVRSTVAGVTVRLDGYLEDA